MAEQIIVNDWNDMDVRDELMNKYGDSSEPFFGKNDDGEMCSINIYDDKIIVETLQDNGWIRRDFYYRDEDFMEEIFVGKWN